MEFVFIILLLAYPLMGVVQVLGALIRLLANNNKYPTYKKRLGRYLLMVGGYFLIMLLIIETGSGDFEPLLMIYLFILPWGLAIYYWNTIADKPIVATDTPEDLVDDLLFN